MSGSVKFLLSVFLGLVMLGISRPAAAQDVPMIEVSGGYNYLKGTVPVFSGRDVPPASTRSVSYANGFYGDLAINTPKPKKMLALLLQFSYNPKTIDGEEASQRVFMAGVRLNSRKIQKTVLFVHILGGDTNSKFGNVHPTSTSANFDEWLGFYTMQVGGGASFMVSPKVGVRVGADFVQVHGKHDSTVLNEGFNEVRIAAGVVLPFGKR